MHRMIQGRGDQSRLPLLCALPPPLCMSDNEDGFGGGGWRHHPGVMKLRGGSPHPGGPPSMEFEGPVEMDPYSSGEEARVEELVEKMRFTWKGMRDEVDPPEFKEGDMVVPMEKDSWMSERTKAALEAVKNDKGYTDPTSQPSPRTTPCAQHDTLQHIQSTTPNQAKAVMQLQNPKQHNQNPKHQAGGRGREVVEGHGRQRDPSR